MTVELFGWLCAGISLFSLLGAQFIYWYDLCLAKLWMDNHLRREGQPVPVRKGFRWWLFLSIRRRFS